jgi:hypothetical protein
MELLLNIFAAATILALIAIWRGHWALQPRRGPGNVARECMAVCCLALLIFFAISMTDDLQGDLTVLEECSLSRSNSVLISGAHHSHHEKIKINPASMAILASAIALNLSCLTARIDPAVYPSTYSLSLSLLPTRAPPLSL